MIQLATRNVQTRRERDCPKLGISSGSEGEAMQVFLGQAPSFVWWGILIFLLPLAASIVLRAYAILVEKRGNRDIGLAALQGSTEKSVPSKRTASK